uniref:Uncharacterized protein n=1 Tax=Arundo donax TaxID=35708 RepID=A0A0A8YGV4_ARUDO
MTLYSVLSLFFIGSVYCMTRDDDYDPDVYYI